MFIDPSETDNAIRHVNGLSPLEYALVKAYLQGCVYCWCNNKENKETKENEAFKAQKFLGDKNYYWQGTPMYCLYAKRLRENNGDSNAAAKQASHDAGHILKDLLKHDKRNFHTWSGSRSRWYQWDGRSDEDNPYNDQSYHPYISDIKQSLEPDKDSFIE